MARTFKDEDVPSPEDLAAYVEAINIFAKEKSLDKNLDRLIFNLPAPTKIRDELSNTECRIVFETVGYLWKKLTGKDLIEESKITKTTEELIGNYWILKNGVILHGINHYSVIKNNSSIFSALLNLNEFALQEYLASPPHRVIGYIIKNGGVRFFTNGKKAYFQMSEDTYAKWGRSKVKKYDFKDKTVKIVDFKVKYSGWKNGIPVKL